MAVGSNVGTVTTATLGDNIKMRVFAVNVPGTASLLTPNFNLGKLDV